MKALRVANWERFEKADSRKCVSMSWVAVPINHDGLGYLELMSHPDGIRMIGGWLLILQVAARCPERGLLVADSGRVLGAKEIALKTRAQEKDISRCIETLLSNGWLVHTEVSGQHPDNVRTTSGLQDITVQDSTEQCAQPPAAPSPKRFAPPALVEVQEYCEERRNGVDAEKWMSHYEANGWKVGRNPMKDWRAAVRTWEKGTAKPGAGDQSGLVWDADNSPEAVRKALGLDGSNG